MKRYGLVVTHRVDAEQVKQYLPGNYKVVWSGPYTDNRAWVPNSWELNAIIIAGTDDHGWTLDGYVIPRLASGLISCVPVTEQEAIKAVERGVFS